MQGLTFQINTIDYFVKFNTIISVEYEFQLTSTPFISPVYSGFFHKNGVLYPIIDFKKCITGRETNLTSNSSILLLQYAEFSYGLILDQIPNMIHLNSAHTLDDLEDFNPDFPLDSFFISEIYLHNDIKYFLLDLASLTDMVALVE